MLLSHMIDNITETWYIALYHRLRFVDIKYGMNNSTLLWCWPWYQRGRWAVKVQLSLITMVVCGFTWQ